MSVPLAKHHFTVTTLLPTSTSTRTHSSPETLVSALRARSSRLASRLSLTTRTGTRLRAPSTSNSLKNTTSLSGYSGSSARSSWRGTTAPIVHCMGQRTSRYGISCPAWRSIRTSATLTPQKRARGLTRCAKSTLCGRGVRSRGRSGTNTCSRVGVHVVTCTDGGPAVLATQYSYSIRLSWLSGPSQYVFT